jgi:hypothetical protein
MDDDLDSRTADSTVLLVCTKNTCFAMASDPDSCLPGPLKDFVFDLHDTARRSQLPIEQGTLYNGTFREITAKVRDKMMTKNGVLYLSWILAFAMFLTPIPLFVM